jgi:ABC-2 type transport system ATP-binding protein
MASSAVPAEASASVLSVEKISKRFGEIEAIRSISLELRAGECLGFLGPNGAGKSTLIRAIVGRVVPDSGRIQILGSQAGSTAARAALGWVPQELAVYPRLSCRENLETFGRYHGLQGPELAASVAWCLKWAALEDRAADLARTLSGGMKRRLNMAAGMIHKPRIVLMDEPTVGVDPQSRNRIFEMIEALRAEGMAIIYTTHYMEEAERLCDRIAIIDHGHVIASGTSAELVQNAFAGRSQVLIRFAADSPSATAWAESRGARIAANALEIAAEFTIEHSTDIAPLLESAAQAGLEIADLSLRRPNLESVFLHLTGKELRE